MGSSSKNLIVYATASNNQNVPLFYLIKKTDGSLASTFYLNDTNLGEISPPSYYNYKFKLMSAKSPSEVYLALSKPNGYYWGFLKFNDLSIDNSIKYVKQVSSVIF